MYWQPEARLIFLAHPRTASRSIANALRLQCGFESGGNHHRPPIVKGDDWNRFTVVRNHFDAIASWWFYLTGRDGHEEALDSDFVQNLTNPRGPHGELFPEPHRFWGLHLDDADYVIRYENLKPDLNTVLGRTGLKVNGMQRAGHQFRNGVPYEKVIDKYARRFIEDWFAQELQELDYSYD